MQEILKAIPPTPEIFFKFNYPINIYEILPHMSKSSDFQQAIEMLDLNFRGPEEPTRNEFAILLKRGVYRIFVLKKDDLPNGKTVAGVAAIVNWGMPQTHLAYHLEYVAITDACQGKGLGTLFMRGLINRFRKEVYSIEKGAKMLTLESEKRLMGFYSKLDFRVSPVTKPRVWEIEANGKMVPHEYFLMGAPLTDPDLTKKYLDNKDFVRPYRKQLKNKPKQILTHLRRKKSLCYR